MTRTAEMQQSIAVVDLGGQYCHMIGRRLRDLGVRSDILPHNASCENLAGYAGIILSGGPQSVYAQESPKVDSDILKLEKPILGICYGHQLLAKLLDCDVTPGNEEYGQATLTLRDKGSLFYDTPKAQTVWMSHGDSVRTLSAGLKSLARTDACKIAAFGDFDRKLFGVQFHPEVDHTQYGRQLLENFTRKICEVRGQEKIEDTVNRLIQSIHDRVGKRSVFFFVSGGVDSTVAFTLCARALPKERVIGVYVDTGMMRKNETEELRDLLSSAGLSQQLRIYDASDQFLTALKGQTDPEKKRKIIGKQFIEVQSQAMREYGIDSEHWMLGQGTIYPDTIESGGASGVSALIKTHHNRCDEVREMIANDRVIEPLAEFYKDEVRKIGRILDLSEKLTGRWPFPGPGLAIRVLGTEKTEQITKFPLEKKFKNYKAYRFPIRSVGVQGDGRTYREIVAIRGPLSDYKSLAELSVTLCNRGRIFNRAIVQVAGSAIDLSEGQVRCGGLSKARIELLRQADHVVRTKMEERNQTKSVWQFPVVLIPVSLEGGETIVLRPVNSEDGMTANWARLQLDLLKEIGEAVAEIPGIDAVFLDITDKPPATIEWE